MRVDPTGALDTDNNDWYKTKNGEIKYNENIHTEKEMRDMGIKGQYLGKTYKEGNNYYSLFGKVKDLKTREGNLYEKIDQAFINYANYIKKYDLNASEFPVEQSTDFNIGVPFKKNTFGFSDYNDYTFNYEAPKGYQWEGKPNSKPIGPHWDYRDPTGRWFRLHPDGTVKPK